MGRLLEEAPWVVHLEDECACGDRILLCFFFSLILYPNYTSASEPGTHFRQKRSSVGVEKLFNRVIALFVIASGPFECDCGVILYSGSTLNHPLMSWFLDD